MLRNITGLDGLFLDLSFNPRMGDAYAHALEAALSANPQLTNVTVALEAANISDSGAANLGQLLQSKLAHATALAVNVRRNAADENETPNPMTSVGAGKLSSSIGQMQMLQNLTLSTGYDSNMGYKGLRSIAVGLQPLQRSSLQYLRLGFGYTTIKDKPTAPYMPALACLGKVLGGFKQLRTLSLDLDTVLNDPQAVTALGIHLACLPVGRMALPGFQGFHHTTDTDCHCGLGYDSQRKCLIPNSVYQGDLGKNCFKCIPAANATACEE